MKPSIHSKLQTATNRYLELQNFLSKPDIINDMNKFRELSKEYAQIEPLVQLYEQYKYYVKAHEDSEAILTEEDIDLQQLAKQEIKQAAEQLILLEKSLLMILIPKDPHDNNN